MLYLCTYILAFVAGAVAYRCYAGKVITELMFIAADAKRAEIAARDAVKG